MLELIKDLGGNLSKRVGLYKCGCGNTKELLINNVRSGRTYQLDCCYLKQTNKECELLIGSNLSMITITGYEIRGRKAFIKGVCSCGGDIDYTYLNSIKYIIKRGNKVSCGCLSKLGNNKKHGMTSKGGKKTRIYRIWSGVIGRCNCPTDTGYKLYGGRGIKCEWKSFEEFYRDMGKCYHDHINEFGEKNTSLERIDNYGNYCKENCKWATIIEQSHNKRNKVLWWGKTVKEIANLEGVSTRAIYARIRKSKEILSNNLITNG